VSRRGAARARASLAFTGALRGLAASPVTSAVATATIALCLLLAGAFALLLGNMERVLERFGEEVHVSAYLADGLAAAEQERLAEGVGALPGVESVTLVTKEAALERFRASPFGRAALVEGLDENPLPASLEVVLAPEARSRDGVEALVAALRGVPGIAELGYGHEWVDGYARAVSVVRGLALAIGAVLALATLLIVANTIRLSIYARRDELEILQLVGAGRVFVATPFLLEGVLEGALGGLGALAALAAGFRAARALLGGGLELLLGYVEPSFFGVGGALALVAAGAALGLVGSAAAMTMLRVARP
jgi:cell division transport system permease protein